MSTHEVSVPEWLRAGKLQFSFFADQLLSARESTAPALSEVIVRADGELLDSAIHDITRPALGVYTGRILIDRGPPPGAKSLEVEVAGLEPVTVTLKTER